MSRPPRPFIEVGLSPPLEDEEEEYEEEGKAIPPDEDDDSIGRMISSPVLVRVAFVESQSMTGPTLATGPQRKALGRLKK